MRNGYRYALNCFHVRDVIDQFDIFKQQNSDPEVTEVGLSTGFFDLDRFIKCIQPSDFIVIGSPVGHGKTQLLLSILHNLSQQNHDGAILHFSTGMSKQQMVQGLLCIHHETDPLKLRDETLSDIVIELLHQPVETLSKLPLYINDSSGTSIGLIEEICKHFESEYQRKLSLAVLQRFQDIDGYNQYNSKVDEHSDVSCKLKQLAEDLNVPVVATVDVECSVLNASRDNFEYPLDDLKPFGTLADDADHVWFLYRDELYDKDSHDKGVAEISIAKNNRGATGFVRLPFSGEHYRFKDWGKE